MRTLFDLIIAADIIRTKLKKNGVIININVIMLLYNNRRGFGKTFDINNRFELYVCSVLN